MARLSKADAAKLFPPDEVAWLMGEDVDKTEPKPKKPPKKRDKPATKAEPEPTGVVDVQIHPGHLGRVDDVAHRMFASDSSVLGRCLVLNRSVEGTSSTTCPYAQRERLHDDPVTLHGDREGSRSGLPGQLHDKAIMAKRSAKYVAAVKKDEPKPTRWARLHAWLTWASESLGARERVASVLRLSRESGTPLRLHDRGDFGGRKGRTLDRTYLKGVRQALDDEPGAETWCYTHVFDRRVAALQNHGLRVFAVIHSEQDAEAAKAAGFARWALIIPQRPNCRSRAATSNLPVYDGPPSVRWGGRTFKLCPATLERGDKRISCSECRMCIEGNRDVAFLTT